MQELELDERGEVLQRWLAHHLAELIAEANQTEGEAKALAQQRAVDLILKLWMHRRALPENVDPLGGYREAISVLSRLKPEADPWSRFRRYPGHYDDILQEMFATLSRTMLSGLVLTLVTQTRSVGDAELNALEEEELLLSQELTRWMSTSREGSSPPVQITFSSADDQVDEDEAVEIEEGESQEAPPPESYAHNMVLQNLERFQDELETLIERWKSSAPDDELMDEGDDWEDDSDDQQSNT